MMKELVQRMAEALVDNPESVEVNVVEGENRVIFELKVHPEDIGKVIGKEGRTARAMRTILSAAATKLNKKATLDIVE